jgi:type I restriction enzyme M protein
VSDFARTVSQAQVARLAGVAPAAVSQWRQRHADFPAPVGVAGNQFLLSDVIAWLDGRPVPVNLQMTDEAAGTTYSDRVRRRLRPTERPDTDMLLRSLLALGREVRGDARRTDYLYLLVCLAFLRQHHQDRWVRLTRDIPATGDSAEARRLLRRVIATVDGALGYPEPLRARDAPPTRLRPRTFEPLRKVVDLAAGLLPSDFGRLRAELIRELRVHDGAICTPPSVTRTMVKMLAGHTVEGNVRLYDPFARFGELLAEFVQAYVDPATVGVRAECPRPDELRLAGIWLAASGTPAELVLTHSPPPGGATFLLTNPPFGGHEESVWLRRCVASLSENGRAAVLMPYGAGFAVGARAHDVRRELVEQGAVLAVVALPAQMFPGTSIGVSVWLLRPPTGRAAPVQLVDARQLGRPSGTPKPIHVLDPADIATIADTVKAFDCRPNFSVIAAPDEIRDHGYSLHPPEYQDRTLARTSAHAARAQLDALFDDLDSPSYTTAGDEGWPRRRLGDLCDISIGVPHGSLKPAISRAHTARDAMPVVHPRHLRNGLIDAVDAPDADVTTLEGYRLHTGDVLCVRTGAMGQTAIVRDSESGWLPHTNLLRLRVTETAELHPAYLYTYLTQAGIQARIQDRAVRSLTTSLSTATLKDLEIPLPPFTDQPRILSALRALDEKTATIERRLAAARAARAAFGWHLTSGTVVLTGKESK